MDLAVVMTRTRAIAHVIASVILACAFAFLALCFIVGLMSIWAFVAFFVVIIAALLWPLREFNHVRRAKVSQDRGRVARDHRRLFVRREA